MLLRRQLTSRKREDEGATFDWFKTYDEIEPYLKQHMPETGKASRILMLGCGNSSAHAAYIYSVGLLIVFQ